jgi:hypothetical protein
VTNFCSGRSSSVADPPGPEGVIGEGWEIECEGGKMRGLRQPLKSRRREVVMPLMWSNWVVSRLVQTCQIHVYPSQHIFF